MVQLYYNVQLTRSMAVGGTVLEYCVIVQHQIIFINGSCLILVLTTVLGLLRRADTKNDVENYQGPSTSLENMI